MVEPDAKSSLKIVVLGDEKRRHQLFGRTFELLESEPVWFLPDQLQSILEFAPEVVLTTEEWIPEWRLAVAEVKRAGVPVIYVMDGVIEWAYIWENQSFVQPNGTVLQPLLADKLCAIGRHPARLLASLGLADRTEIVGLPRLDEWTRKREIRTGEKKSIVITTARTYAHNTSHKIWLLSALTSLVDYFNRNLDKLDVVWRIPDELAQEIGVSSDQQGDIGGVLSISDALISFPSSTILEGMKIGLPTAIVDFRPTPQLISSAWNIRSAAHIEPVVQELIHPSPLKMAFQEYCFEQELEPGDATSRLANVINKTVGASPITIPETRPPAASGPLDFRQVHSQISTFSVPDVSMLQYELDAAYKVIEKYRTELQHLGERNKYLERIENSNYFKIILKLLKKLKI